MSDKKEVFEGIINDVIQICRSGNNSDEVLEEICRILNERVDYYNWVGVYIMSDTDNKLHLGPYVGSPTEHTIIPIGVGVCGQVAETLETKVIQDVKNEDNYLSCSPNINSEIVVPIIKGGKIVAELDIDSNTKAPFTTNDIWMLEKISSLIKDYF